MNKMGAMNAEEMKNYKGVFVFAQQVDNKLSGISFELIGEGKRLAEKLDEQVTAVLIGSDVKGLVDDHTTTVAMSAEISPKRNTQRKLNGNSRRARHCVSTTDARTPLHAPTMLYAP